MVARKTRAITRKQKQVSFHQTSLSLAPTRASMVLAKATANASIALAKASITPTGGNTALTRENTGQHIGAIKAENTKIISVGAEEATNARGGIAGSVLEAVSDEKTNDCRNVMYVTSLRRGTNSSNKNVAKEM